MNKNEEIKDLKTLLEPSITSTVKPSTCLTT